MKKELFKPSSEEKKFIQQTSSLCGIKQDSFQYLMEYIIYSNIINLLDNENTTIKIPGIGEIRFDKDLKSSIDLTEEFYNMIKNVKQGNVKNITEYFESNWLSKITDEVLEKYKN